MTRLVDVIGVDRYRRFRQTLASLEVVSIEEDELADVQDVKDLYPGEFLRVVAGSTSAGLSLGTGDRDELGIRIEPREAVLGMERFEQHVYRTKAEGEPSDVGDLDLTVYGLRKYLSLACKGNPTIVNLVFIPEEFVVHQTPLADELRGMAPYFLSKAAGGAFLGYLAAQRQRLLGERGGRKPQRPRNEKGYDGKYASHMLRLGFQGIELLESGRITLPMPSKEREYCLAVKRGEVELDDVLTRTGELERDLADLRDLSPLRDEPDRQAINEWLADVYLREWAGK